MIRRLLKQLQKPFLVWFLMFLLGFIYLTIGIGHEALWYDESYSAAIINYSTPEILHLVAYDVHPPLYYVMLRFISLIFGSSEASLRFLSVLGALAFVSLGLGPVRRIYDNFTGFIFSFIVLAAPMTLSMGQEARMYTWSAFFVTGSVLYGYLGIKDNKPWDWIRFALLTFASAYIHYFALLAVSIANVLMFLWIILLKRERLRNYILSALGALIGFLPWMPAFLNQASMTSKEFWIPPVSLKVIVSTLVYPFRAKFDAIMPLAIVCFIGTVILIVLGFILAKKNKESIALPAFAILTYSLTLLSAILISNVIRPIFVERYIFPSIGLLLLAAAFGISRINNKKVSIVIMIAFAILSFPQVFRIYTEKFNGPMREVTATLKSDVKKDDVFIHTHEHTYGTFSYYFPENKHIYYIPHVPLNIRLYDVFKKNGIVTTDFLEAIKNYKNIWIVDRIGNKCSSKYYGWYDSGLLKKTKVPINFQIQNSWFRLSVVPVVHLIYEQQ